jgi:hypothetical protein
MTIASEGGDMKKVFVYALFLALVSVTHAQETRPQPSPEQVREQMEAAFGAMAPFMGKMMEAMIEAQLTVVSKPASAEKMAQYVKNFYEALLKQGFSKHEALRIVTSISMPSASPSTK